MKKPVLALAVLGTFAGAAQAQSHVQFYGSIDGGVRHLTNANGAGDNLVSLGQKTMVAGSPSNNVHTGTFNSNRLGFRGVEDLGGGLRAQFALETGLDSANGTLDNNVNKLFNRAAWVGLGGNWGSVDVGRQYSVSFKTIGGYDPFNYKYTTIIPLATAAAGTNSSLNPFVGTFGGIRFDNDVQYTRAFGPVTMRTEYSLGEQSGSTSRGSAAAVGGTFAKGPLSVGAAYTTKKPGATVPAPGGVAAFQDNDQWTIGGAYRFGPARLAAGYINEKQETGTGSRDSKVKNAWAGVSYAFTPAFELTAAFYQTKADVAALTSTVNTLASDGKGKRDLVIVGGTYAFSKRTNLYFDVDHAKLSGIMRVGYTPAHAVAAVPAPTQTRQTGMSVGVNHLF